MNARKAVQIAASALAVGTLSYFAARPGGPGLTPGAPAPDFRLTDLSGRTVTLADYKGKVLLLEFWATWCGTCESEVPALKALHERFEGPAFSLVAASVDQGGPEVVARYAAERSLPYRVVFADEAASKAYRIWGLPTKFLIGPDGTIVKKYLDAVEPALLEADIKAQLARSSS